jgi:tetratricopeptide (TPR) repeat protein
LEPALQEFRRALQVHSRDFWTNYFLGVCSITSGKAEVAVAHLTVCQSERPQFIWIYLLRGFALGQLHDYAAAEADFDRALTLQPGPATLYVLYNNRGVMRAARPDAWEQGVQDLKQAAALGPDHFQACSSLSEAYRLAKRLDEAVRHQDQAIAIARRQVRAETLAPETLALLHHSRARLHLQRADQEAAVRDLREAAQLAGDDHALRGRVEADHGRVLQLQQHLEEALQAYDRALQADPGRVLVWRWRGEVFLLQEEYAKAVQSFTAYLDEHGEAAAAVFQQRGFARTKLLQHAEAVNDYSRALEATAPGKEQTSLYLARGQEYLQMNALEPALHDLEQALRLDATNRDARLGCAAVHLRRGRLTDAVAEAEKALVGDPQESRLWLGAARVYAQAAAQVIDAAETSGPRRQPTRERAAVLLRTALRLTPENQKAQFWRDNVGKDKLLSTLRNDLTDLVDRFGGFER